MAERLDDLVASWRRHLRAADKAPRTVELYGQSVRFFTRWLTDRGRQPTLDELTRSAIAHWLGDLADAGQSTNTLSTRFRGLRRFCRWLVAENLVDRSPMEGMEQPKAAPQPVPILTDEEIGALLKATAGSAFADRRDHAILRVLFDCGVRISEVTRLTLLDVDFDVEVVRVIGKGRKVRVVPFGAKTSRALDRYLRERRKHPKAGETDRLWLSQRGPLSVDGLDERIRIRGTQAGVVDLHAHRFRHTAAHSWLAAGGGEQDLKRLMGWTSDAMLAVYGSSAAEQRAREAARRLRLGDRL
ncbi:MAG: tyrosine-type recombinase/integrase [Streptosporangiales bacterium]|nr:tyrosine-type recombinase/integrase [Streptosporangiales bacterium]